MKRMGVLVATALLTLMTACSQKEEPAYDVMETNELIAQIEALPGVTRVDINGNDSAGVGGSQPAYHGQVRIQETADPLEVLDHVLAILWQGMEGAALDVAVRQGDTFYDTRSVHLGANRLEERYGDQPGSGVPPTDEPPLELAE